MMNELKKPRMCSWLLGWFIPEQDRETLLSSMEEVYRDILKKKGRRHAARWFWLQFIKSLPSFIESLIGGYRSMFGNYLKVAWRNLKRHVGYSSINVMGLAVGMACCILIFLWVQDEVGYDTFHTNSEHIYRVIQETERRKDNGF